MSGLIVTQGVVVKVEHREQAIVSGSGGGGGVTTLPGGQVVGIQRAVSISTNIRSKDVIWVRTDKGDEAEFIIHGDSFSCREGHRVAFICSDNALWLARNFTINRTSRYFSLESLQALFSPTTENHGCAILIAVIFGLVGVGGCFGLIADRDLHPLSDRIIVFCLFLFTPLIAFFVLHRVTVASGIKQKEGNFKAQQFMDEIVALEANLTDNLSDQPPISGKPT